MTSQEILKKTIPLAVTFGVGIVMIIEWYMGVSIPSVRPIASDLRNFAIIIAAAALGLGAINLFRMHTNLIRKKTPRQWYFSIWLLFVMCLYAVIGVGAGPAHGSYVWLYNNIMLPLGATLFALQGFYVCIACYRVFKFRGLEATVLLLAGAMVIANNAPALSAAFPWLGGIARWTDAVITTAAFRGVLIGIGLGTITIGIRTLLGLETGYLGRKEGE